MGPSRLSAIVAVVFAAGAAFAQPQPRTIEAISVTGNERFSGADVIATAGLRPGQTVGEDELRAAVEALEGTAEFRRVRITTDGPSVRIAVEEEPAFSGALTFGLGFDTADGAIGFAAITLRDALGEGTVFDGRLSISEEVARAALDWSTTRPVGQADGAGIRAFAEEIDRDETDFSFSRVAVSPYITIRTGRASTVELRYAISRTNIGELSGDTSPILEAERGSETSSGVGVSFRTARRTGRVDWSFRVDQDFTGVGGTTQLSRTQAFARMRAPLGRRGFAVRSRFAAGAVEGLGDDAPRVSDRFTLGGAALRGFEGGTVAPRDVTADTSTILGGDRFATLQTDVLVPIFPERSALETFAFVDLGSVWGLETETDPAGSLDTSFDLRSSFGIGASSDTPFGRFEAYYAIETDGPDPDDEERFGITFRSSF